MSVPLYRTVEIAGADIRTGDVLAPLGAELHVETDVHASGRVVLSWRTERGRVGTSVAPAEPVRVERPLTEAQALGIACTRCGLISGPMGRIGTVLDGPHAGDALVAHLEPCTPRYTTRVFPGMAPAGTVHRALGLPPLRGPRARDFRVRPYTVISCMGGAAPWR